MGILCWFFVFIFRGQSVFFWVLLWFVLFLVPFWVVGLSSFGLWGGYFLFAFFVLFCFFFMWGCCLGFLGVVFFQGVRIVWGFPTNRFYCFWGFWVGVGFGKKKKKKKK